MYKRQHIGYTAYHAAVAVKEKEGYLLKKCEEPEFFYNMQYHTDLCKEVQENARSSPLLKAFNTMAINTYMCGTHPCSEVVRSIVSAIGWQILAALAVAGFVVINMAFLTMRNFSSWRSHRREAVLRDRHGRHGLAYYADYVHDLQNPGPAGRIQIQELEGGAGGTPDETMVLKNGVLTGAFVRSRGGGGGDARGQRMLVAGV